MDSTIKGSLIGAGALVVGICVSEFLAWIRGNRLRGSERRLLAGALAAELCGFFERWNETKAFPGISSRVILRHWAGDDSFPVYDGAAGRLSLLPRELSVGTVRCYTQLRVLQEKLRWASERDAGLTDATASAKRASRAGEIPRSVQDYANRALRSAGEHASRLDDFATGKYRLRASLGRRINRRCLRFLKRVWGRFRRR